MRLPDPIANTTTEAYLAYKAGVLEVGDLKPSLYDPYLHFDAWLAYWCGLTNTYPITMFETNMVEMDSETRSSNGVTAVAKSGMGKVVLNGKAISTGAQTLFDDRTVEIEAGKTYTISANNPVANSDVSLRLFAGGTTYVATLQLSSKNATYTFTADGDYTCRTQWRTASGAECNDFVMYPMLELGDTASVFHPRVGAEMLTDEEALVAYLSGVTDTYPEEIKDPYDVRIVGYLKYLVSVKYGRPEYPVNNEEFYLSMLMPSNVSNDTPASSITLQGTAKYPFLDLLMHGDCAQQTYSGKNLFNKNATTVFHTRTSVTALDTGVRATVTQDTSGVAMAGFILGKASDYVGQTLTLSSDLANTAGTLPRVYLGLSNSSGADRVLKASLASSGQVSWTVTEDADRPYLLLVVYSAAVAEGASAGEYCDYTNLQVEASASATSYEPYVGGIPAPNPDYPQEVHMVTGKQIVKATGKNLFNNQSVEIGKNYGGGIGTIPYPFNSQPNRAAVLIPIEASTTYNFSMTDGSLYLMEVRECAADYTVTRLLSSPLSNNVDFNFTSQSTGKYLVAKFKYGSAGTEDITQAMVDALTLQLEKGSTATSYEPYESKSTVVPLTGKNMFDKDNANILVSYFDGSTTTITADNRNRTIFIPCLPNTTYTVSKIASPETRGIGYTKVIPTNGVQVYGITNIARNGTTGTITTGANAKYLAVRLWSSAQDTSTTLEQMLGSVQIELGSEATPYTQYRAPIELCKIGDYQDYIYKDQDGDWYLHKAIGLRTYASPGDSLALRNTSAKGTYTYSTTAVPDYKYEAGVSVISKQFKNIGPVIGLAPMYNALLDTVGVALYYSSQSSTDRVIYFNSNIQASTLLANGIDIYYPMATPTDTLITYPDVVDALNEIIAGGSYKDTTHIKVTADDDNLPGLLTVTAGRE